MTSPWGHSADLARFYTVTEPQRHPKGYTVYKVTARIIVWKRYSDFKKLHRDLWQIHRNAFRHSELFPPFAKGTVFGRFDKTVIEERRQCAEDLLQFSANIPALYNSEQLQDFFKGGIISDGSELIGPAEAYPDSLANTLPECGTEGFSSDSDLLSLTVDVDSLAEVDDGMASRQGSPSRTFGLNLSTDSSAVGAVASDSEPSRAEERESRSLFPSSLKARRGRRDYLEKAGELIQLALKKEEEDDYEAASDFYRKGVDLLLEGVQGESSPTRREAVKRRTAEYLMRAESICSLRATPQLHTGSQPPGSLSSRPPWNLRSPAEELKAFRVLGVIDKVLLVMDTRTEQTFILKGLRKSSECSRSRKTIIPRCVPNMVCLHTYIISEESVFLVLQRAEGGKLWSHISKFLNRSSRESLDIQETRPPVPPQVRLQQPSAGPQGGGSLESRGSDPGSMGSMLKALPLKASLTPSSQDDSNQEDDGQDSSPKWPDSGSSSEEECTAGYLTLCNEYGQEKIDLASLNEESVTQPEGDKALRSFSASLTTDHASPSTQLKFFPGDEDLEAVSSPRTSDSLSRSKNSPMEFFRIDSKDSTSELLGLDFGEKLHSLKPEPLKVLFTLEDGDSPSQSFDISKSQGESEAQDSISRDSDDSVPVISFKEAASEDVGGAEEGRPDLLVNLPGEPQPTKEASAMDPTKFSQASAGRLESKLLEAPDVLCLRLSSEQCQGLGEGGPEEPSSPTEFGPGAMTPEHDSQADPGVLFTAAFDDRSSRDQSPLSSLHSESDRPGQVEVAATARDLQESLFHISSPCSGAKEHSARTDTATSEEVLLFTEPTKEERNSLFQRDKERLVGAGEADKEIHQIFEDLDKRLAVSSRFFIPEGCVQRWAAEMVVALDALHREGIVCRDLNPNNILLNDGGHIQLTYFSRWSEVEDSCDSDAAARMYCAPEVGAVTEETEACDWWSLGAVLFELLTGKTLVECHPAGINTHTTLNMPDCVSEEARSLIQQLLQFNPTERLGAGVAGVEDIKSHPFFTPVDWTELTR
ncbi:ribosomal protein S6 kinase delta-1 isoform X2 [Apodemus sylvaticus]|uniref:ribosomal protein S6 kinase delta-1 isoform X2 n=1 Tax=Apodemus sylvaticus TaxID=10129 RepID=UPI00224249C9|nr:ribosomal protein S6 kinase delta-1 isoform X2 [Apodemus sylvaticus]